MAVTINVPSQVRTFANLAAFPASGSLKTIYIAEDTNKTYRWTGSVYVEISASAAGGATWGAITGTLSSQTDLQNALNAKQATLVSGTNIKTIEGQSLLGSGDINLTATDVGLGNVDNTSDLNKPVSTATQTALNLKQDTLISATNIKTVNSTSLLGSGNVAVQDPITLTTTGTSGAATLVGATLNIPQYSGGGLSGVHALVQPTTGQVMSPSLIGAGLNSIATTANRLTAQPFIPSKTFTTSNLYINVSTLGLGVNARILIYSDLNGIPTTKLYESANLDCSTTGQKTATTSFTFTAGTTYWLCTHFSGIANMTSFTPTGVITILISGTANIASYIYTYTFGSAPTTLTGQGNSVTSIPAVFITSA